MGSRRLRVYFWCPFCFGFWYNRMLTTEGGVLHHFIFLTIRVHWMQSRHA